MYREETLLNVMRSVTRNGRSILLTAVLALVLVYMFSIVGYMFFRDHFLVSVDRLDGQLKKIHINNVVLPPTAPIKISPTAPFKISRISPVNITLTATVKIPLIA